jgi:RimJ/RimL family protein N-acetyltransferase
MLTEQKTEPLDTFPNSQKERVCGLPVYLLPLSRNDYPFVIDLFEEEEVLRGVTRSALDTPEKIVNWISGVHERDDCLQFIILRADNHSDLPRDIPAININQLEKDLFEVPLGIITLKDIDKDNSKAATIGIAITGRAQGKGVGKKALAELIGYCRSSLSDKVSTLNAEIYNDNGASIALFSSLGFSSDGIIENEGRKGHTWSLLIN